MYIFQTRPRLEYLVRWVDYKSTTWEPWNFCDSCIAVDAYLEKHDFGDLATSDTEEYPGSDTTAIEYRAVSNHAAGPGSEVDSPFQPRRTGCGMSVLYALAKRVWRT